jgi:outer membrane biosynthesis protein TonB
MVPQSQQRKPRNSSKVNLLISMTFHGLLVVAVLYFAARQGLLGKQLRKIAVEMVKEKPPEKPKEPEKPKDEPPKVEQPKLVQAPKIEPPREVAPPPPSGLAAPPAAAPPPVDVPSFAFDGGRPVETTSDPVQIYKGLVEYSLRSRWNRPEDEDDHGFVAEVEISVDRSGQISNPVWKKSSGDKRWDASVRDVLAQVKSISHAPPTNFPPRVVVRFDVVAPEPIIQ